MSALDDQHAETIARNRQAREAQTAEAQRLAEQRNEQRSRP